MGYRNIVVNKPILALEEVRAREKREAFQKKVKIQHSEVPPMKGNKQLAMRDPIGALTLPWRGGGWGVHKDFLEKVGFKA